MLFKLFELEEKLKLRKKRKRKENTRKSQKKYIRKIEDRSNCRNEEWIWFRVSWETIGCFYGPGSQIFLLGCQVRFEPYFSILKC